MPTHEELKSGTRVRNERFGHGTVEFDKGQTTIEVNGIVENKTLVVPPNKMSMVGKIRPLLSEKAKSKSVLYHAVADPKDEDISEFEALLEEEHGEAVEDLNSMFGMYKAEQAKIENSLFETKDELDKAILAAGGSIDIGEIIDEPVLAQMLEDGQDPDAET